jgi:hypothetical protein
LVFTDICAKDLKLRRKKSAKDVGSSLSYESGEGLIFASLYFAMDRARHLCIYLQLFYEEVMFYK